MMRSTWLPKSRTASLLVLLLFCSLVHINGVASFPSIPRLSSQFVPATTTTDSTTATKTDGEDVPRMTIENMTCSFFTQPLNHFVPRGRSPTYEQRYCVYDDYAPSDPHAPILFYTGNESPLEQYINHTGLMWELAPQLQARVVFVEHRYEGRSLPSVSTQCMSYASTIQALADYADILQLHLNPGALAPVIVFGGSYGGMLSAWMRMKYPHLVAGAIAASAPIGAFPQMANHRIDGAAQVLAHGLQQTYPPDRHSYRHIGTQDSSPPKSNQCHTNLLATWPLITWLVEQREAEFLQEVFSLCYPYTDPSPDALLEFGQTLWFDLAEGSFPYPSSYIPFALLHKKVNLPAWPLQSACWQSPLHQDFGILLQGDRSDVRYNITYGASGLTLQVDWDKATSLVHPTSVDFTELKGLLTSVRDAIGTWHNVTKDVVCYNASDAAPNLYYRHHPPYESSLSMDPLMRTERRLRSGLEWGTHTHDRIPSNASQECLETIKAVGSWEPICCNDEMNLVITAANGIGKDFFWPPSVPREVQSYQDMIQNVTVGPCPDPDGIFGYSTENYDQESLWLDTYYGSSRMAGHSNIVFSNGLLDPWSAGGVYATYPFGEEPYSGPVVQNITNDDVVAVIIEFGGHHTDLMYTHPLDPECVTEARQVEHAYISRWISQWRESHT
eukprot:Nitzschia sp. Nitz4//scaffold32_size149145//4370//6466//NITZ4_002860-RA/size149145-augustus-gene-0.33-mRNA-1//1//CDS//3329548012//8593//frame0